MHEMEKDRFSSLLQRSLFCFEPVSHSVDQASLEVMILISQLLKHFIAGMCHRSWFCDNMEPTFLILLPNNVYARKLKWLLKINNLRVMVF